MALQNKEKAIPLLSLSRTSEQVALAIRPPQCFPSAARCSSAELAHCNGPPYVRTRDLVASPMLPRSIAQTAALDNARRRLKQDRSTELAIFGYI